LSKRRAIQVKFSGFFSAVGSESGSVRSESID
jgi:hypothetical protein